MNILSELIYEILHFNFMIWLLTFLTLVLWGIPLVSLILNTIRRKSDRSDPRPAESATARITEITPTGAVENGKPEMAVTLEVNSQMRGIYSVERKIAVPVRMMPKLVKGAQVPVRIYGSQPDDVKLVMQGTLVKGVGSVKGVLSSGVFVLFFWVLFGYIFAYSMKGTESYNCALKLARENPQVAAELGANPEPGFFVWTGSSESGGGVSRSSYRFLLKGKKGIGNLYVNSYSAPGMNNLKVALEHDGKQIHIIDGPAPCN